MIRMRPLMTMIVGLLALSITDGPARAQSSVPDTPEDNSSPESATALAKKLQNPIGDLYSFPFQNNTNFNYGPQQGHAGHPQCSAGDSDPHQRGLERHHAHDPAADLAAVAAAGAHRAVRHRPDNVLGIPLAEANRPTAGCGASARSSRCRRSATRPSAPMSGAAVRPARGLHERALGCRRRWPTTCGRSAAPRGVAARATTCS